jgi:hypothetical protein
MRKGTTVERFPAVQQDGTPTPAGMSSRLLKFWNECAVPARIRLQRIAAMYPRPCTTIGARTVGRTVRFGQAPPPKAGDALAKEHLAERQ